jgi:hypothetical protein
MAGGASVEGDGGVAAGVGDMLIAEGVMRGEAESLPGTMPEVAVRRARNAPILAHEKMGGEGCESGGGERR